MNYQTPQLNTVPQYGFMDFVREYFMGQKPQPMTPEQYSALIANELARQQAMQAVPQPPSVDYVNNYRQQYVDPRTEYMRQLRMAGSYGE